jgi:hypothetical protein
MIFINGFSSFTAVTEGWFQVSAAESTSFGCGSLSSAFAVNWHPRAGLFIFPAGLT